MQPYHNYPPHGGGGGYAPPPPQSYHQQAQQPYGQPYYPPPSHQGQLPPPNPYYSQGHPPSQSHGHGYGAPPPSYGYQPYGNQPPSHNDDRYRGDKRDDRGPRRGRGRSRSPLQDRGGASRRPPPLAQRYESRHSGPPIVLPSLNPGEVTFTMFVPAHGLSAQLPAIKEIEKSEGCTISLVEDAQATSSTRRSLRFIGTWEKIRPAQKQVLELIKQVSRNDLALSDDTLILIPKDKAQTITQSLSDIQNSTNTDIEIFPARGGPDAEISLVVIVSRPAEDDSEEQKKNNIANAITKIKECLGLSLLPSELSDDLESWCKVYIPVASRFAGSIIGKNASIVRELESESSARINLSREGTKVETPSEVFRYVTAEGSGAQVRIAHAKIISYLDEAKRKAKEEFKDGHMLKIPLSVPDQLIGVIIGRNGKSLRDLQEDTQTKIHIEHSAKDDRAGLSYRLVEIVGDPEKVERAQATIVERLISAVSDNAPGTASISTTTSNRGRERSPSPLDTRGSSKHPSARGPGGPSGSDGEELDTMVIAVPLAQAGAVIGNRGDTVRQICEASGARIHIEERDKLAPDATERAVTITGTTSQVAKAFSLIQKALSDSAAAEARKAAASGGPPARGSRVDGGGYGGAHQQRHAPSYDPYSQPPPSYGAPPPYGGGSNYGPPQPSQQPANYYAPPPSNMTTNSQPILFGNYPPRSGAPVQLPTLPPVGVQQPHQQQQLAPQFDMNILTQLAKNLPPIGSGVITQITGSPVAPNQPPPNQQTEYRHPY